jgi:hypothetical protein
VYLLVFHAYVYEMHGSRSNILSKNLVRQRCAEEFNSGGKGLNFPQLKFDFLCWKHYNHQKTNPSVIFAI